MKFLSPRAHSIIGLIVGILLVLAPNIFGFTDAQTSASAVPRIIGIIIIISELSVKGSISGFGFISMKMHIIMDVLLGTFLAASPWIFGFNDDGTNAWLPHLLVGLIVIGYALVTRTNEEEEMIRAN
jgi:hypothetical protein